MNDSSLLFASDSATAFSMPVEEPWRQPCVFFPIVIILSEAEASKQGGVDSESQHIVFHSLRRQLSCEHNSQILYSL